MPKPKRQPVSNPDFVKLVIVAGVFLIAYAVINEVFTLANTKILQPAPTTDLSSETLLVTTELIKMQAKVLVDAREEWQSTNLFVEKGATIKIKVVDGKWTEWKGERPYNTGNGSDYICARTMQAERCVEPIPDYPSGALIGKIDRQILRIGNGSRFVVQQSGTLLLRINDADQGLYDNDGVLVVEIVVE